MPSDPDVPADPDCILCGIVAGTIPSYKIYEDDHVLSFLDIGPLARGHVLLIPKAHYVTLDTMPDDLAADCARVLPSLARAVMTVSGRPDFNILQNNGAPAGQIVNHVHFHIIPRREGDSLGYRWPAGKLADDEARRLQQAFTGQLR